MAYMKEREFQELYRNNHFFRTLVNRDGREYAIDTLWELIDQSDYEDFDIEDFLHYDCNLEPDYVFDVIGILKEYTGKTLI